MHKTLCLAALTAVSLSLGGCSSNKDTSAVSYSKLRSNLTPELQGTVARPVDHDRYFHTTANMNWRSAQDDISRIFYTDHPSRLSPFPIVYTSTQPR